MWKSRGFQQLFSAFAGYSTPLLPCISGCIAAENNCLFRVMSPLPLPSVFPKNYRKSWHFTRMPLFTAGQIPIFQKFFVYFSQISNLYDFGPAGNTDTAPQ